MDASYLFKPFNHKGLTLNNRIVMAPMTRSFSPGGVPGKNVVEYYARRAKADVGLIVTEGTTVDRKGASFDPKVPNFHKDDALAGWKTVCDAVHREGGKIAPQLWHVGLARKPGTGPHPDAPSDSPSGKTHEGKDVAPVPTDEDIADMISAFGKAAGHAKALGFDTIEIHGAHGYLIDQFFWDAMNRRDDNYGGGLVERTSFAQEIVKSCRKAVGADMPIILRFSQWKQQDYTARLAETPELLGEFTGALADAGVDIFHCSQRRYWEPEFEDSKLNLAGWVKKLTGQPTISVGSVGLDGDFFGAFAGKGAPAASLDSLIGMIDRDEFDMIAVGRALLHDPFWAQKVKEGRMDELQAYDGEALKTLF